MKNYITVLINVVGCNVPGCSSNVINLLISFQLIDSPQTRKKAFSPERPQNAIYFVQKISDQKLI